MHKVYYLLLGIFPAYTKIYFNMQLSVAFVKIVLENKLCKYQKE